MIVKMPKKGGREGGSRPETGLHPPPPKLSRASLYPYGFPSFLFLFIPPPLYPPCLVTESSGMGRGAAVGRKDKGPRRLSRVSSSHQKSNTPPQALNLSPL